MQYFWSSFVGCTKHQNAGNQIGVKWLLIDVCLVFVAALLIVMANNPLQKMAAAGGT
jgi:hypothetical protein